MICIIENFRLKTHDGGYSWGPFEVAEDGVWFRDTEFILSHEGKDLLCELLQRTKPWTWPPLERVYKANCVCTSFDDGMSIVEMSLKMRINGESFQCDLYGHEHTRMCGINHPISAFLKEFFAIFKDHNYVDWNWYK